MLKSIEIWFVYISNIMLSGQMLNSLCQTNSCNCTYHEYSVLCTAELTSLLGMVPSHHCISLCLQLQHEASAGSLSTIPNNLLFVAPNTPIIPKYSPKHIWNKIPTENTTPTILHPWCHELTIDTFLPFFHEPLPHGTVSSNITTCFELFDHISMSGILFVVMISIWNINIMLRRFRAWYLIFINSVNWCDILLYAFTMSNHSTVRFPVFGLASLIISVIALMYSKQPAFLCTPPS